MYPGPYAQQHPDRPAVILAETGAQLSYAEFEARANRLAHFLKSLGLKRLDHYAIFMENNLPYLETCAAGERSGLYYTCINAYLTGSELAYILQNSESQVLITSKAKLDIALEAVADCPMVQLVLVVGASSDDLPTGGQFASYEDAIASHPSHAIEDEVLGTSMLYSSGTTGRPKGIIRPLPPQAPAEPLPLYSFLLNLWQYREDMIYLSPAPLYHSAPQAAVNLALRMGGTVVIMERFDAEQYLSLIGQYQVTHSQLVPTMFSRMLKLPETVREQYDLSTLEIAIHAAAPCPVLVKQQMIEWWGPVIVEYYSSSEGAGFTLIDSASWLEHKGSVGKALFGVPHILDDEGNELGAGEVGTIWFSDIHNAFEYHNEPTKTKEAYNANGWTTIGDVGYLDAEGFLYLTDRRNFTIITGGVNVYPAEIENLLIGHEKVADVAVFGIADEEFGEVVQAVVQPANWSDATDDLAAELIAWMKERLSTIKVPKSLDFMEQLPRMDNGKLYKRHLMEAYRNRDA